MSDWRIPRLCGVLAAALAATFPMPSLFQAAETSTKGAKAPSLEHLTLQEWAQKVGDKIEDGVSFDRLDERHTLSFDETGCACAVRVRFAMISRLSTSLAIKLPTPAKGRFTVVLETADALYDVKNVRVENGGGVAEIAAKYQNFPFDDIRKKVDAELEKLIEPGLKQAQVDAGQLNDRAIYEEIRKRFGPGEKPPPSTPELFVRLRALDHTVGPLWKRLNEVAGTLGAAVTKAESDEYAKPKPTTARQVCERCRRLMLIAQADPYVRPLGFDLTKDNPKLERIAESRLAAIRAVMVDGVGKTPIPDIKLLTPDDKDKLRDALLVQVVCRFYPEVDPLDPSAQWFNGQRVSGRAIGAASIRVEGQINPRQQDCVDWWILDPFNKEDIEFTAVEQEGVKIEGPIVDGKLARMRVVAKDQEGGPVKYAVEMRRKNVASSGVKVVIQESPERSKLKFPY